MKIAVTGHRPNKLWGYNTDNPHYNTLFQMFIRALEHHECTLAISGMALGVDTVFALAALHANIPLECAIPCSNHSSKWFGESVKQYNEILKQASKVTYVSDKPYTYRCMQDRNEYMVDNCDMLIAVWDGSRGGTGNCVSYARAVGKPITIITPKEVEKVCGVTFVVDYIEFPEITSYCPQCGEKIR